jgi:hypothetical protein
MDGHEKKTFNQQPISISFHQFPLAETIPGNPILIPHRMPSNFRMPTGTAPTILAGISDVGSQRLLAGLGMNQPGDQVSRSPAVHFHVNLLIQRSSPAPNPT